MTAYKAQAHAASRILAPVDGLDSYALRGVELSRDAAHVVIAALKRDAYDLRTRPASANLEAADLQDALALAIHNALK